MQLPETDTGSFGLYWAVEEYTVSSHVPPLIGTVRSQNLGIPVSRGNRSSCVWAAGNGSHYAHASAGTPCRVLCRLQDRTVSRSF